MGLGEPDGLTRIELQLAAHLQRPLGRSGIRRTRLACLTDGSSPIGYELVHAWRTGGATCSSLFCVLQGSPLASTTVLLVEQRWAPASLWLWLSTSRHVRKLDRFRIEDYVLGSDFVYDDFRFWTPRALTEATVCQARRTPDERIFLHGESLWRRRHPARVDAVVDGCHGMILSAIWSAPGMDHPFRRLTSSRIRVIDGVAAPEVMTVERPREGYESRMELHGQAIDVSLEPDLFTPAGMVGAAPQLAALAMEALGDYRGDGAHQAG